MPRRLIPLLLAVSPMLFAQYGGVVLPGGIRLPVGTGGQYPGGQYPGGQYPGGQYPGGGQPGMSQMLTGNLRQISYTNLIIETDDSRIIMMQVPQNARFYSTFGNARMTDFDPGDYVTVRATQDVNGYYYANTITLNRKGTPEERAAASQPTSTSMHSGGNQSTQNTQSDSTDDGRPVLHRADSGSSSADNGSATDDGRPHMRRADSATTDDGGSSSGSSSASSGSSGSAGTSPARPAAVRATSQGDDSAPAQITPGAPVQSAGVAPMTGDPGPPVLRRGAAARDQAAQSNAPDAVTDSVPQRPSVRAEEVNGVTQLPAAPVSASPSPPASPSIEALRSGEPGMPVPPPGGAATSDPVIDRARDEAFAFTETLPDYIVKQFTTRYQSDSASRGHTSWQALDIVTADVVAENGKESYKNVMVNGKPTKDVDKSGSWSEGEFASTLQAILSPASNALFTNKRSTTIANRAAYHYDYSIEQPRSNWRVYAGGSTYRPAYGGAIWIDKETSRVLRIEMSARNIPRDFPLDQVESTVDYDFVPVGDKKFLLPTHSEALSCQRGTSECTRNVIDFRNYRKYGADTNITFEDAVK